MFSNQQAYLDYIRDDKYWAENTADTLAPLCYVVEASVATGSYSFKLHVSDFLDNQDDITRQSPATDTEILGIIEQNPDEQSLKDYRNGGFLLLMNILGDWVLEQETSDTTY